MLYNYQLIYRQVQMNQGLLNQLIGFGFDPILAQAAIIFNNSNDIEQLSAWITQNQGKQEQWRGRIQEKKRKKQSKMDIEQNIDTSKDDKLIDQIISKMYQNQTFQNLLQLQFKPILCAAALKSTKSTDISALCDWINYQSNNEQKWKKWLIQDNNKPQPQLDVKMLNALLQKNSLGLQIPKNETQLDFKPGQMKFDDSIYSEAILKKKRQITQIFKEKSQQRRRNRAQITKNRINYLKKKYNTDDTIEAFRRHEQAVDEQYMAEFGRKAKRFQAIKKNHPELIFADVFGLNAKPETLQMLGDQLIDSQGEDLSKPNKYKFIQIQAAKIQPFKTSPIDDLPQLPKIQKSDDFKSQDIMNFGNLLFNNDKFPKYINSNTNSRSNININSNYNFNSISNPINRRQVYKQNEQDIMRESSPKVPIIQPPQQQPKFQVLRKKCDNLLKSNTTEQAQTFFKTLGTCVEKIQENFQDPKYRQIKKSNPNTKQKLLSCQNHMEVILDIGFEDSQQFLTLHPQRRTLQELASIRRILRSYETRRKRGS